jgi:hypothetical protein
MSRQINLSGIAVAAASLLVIAAMLGTAIAQKTAPPKANDKLALGAEEVKQLLLLMDTDKNGKISKQEFMSFMEKEFDRLDTDKNGELDPKELTRSQIRASRPYVGK